MNPSVGFVVLRYERAQNISCICHYDRPDMWAFVWFNVTTVSIISHMTMHFR